MTLNLADMVGQQDRKPLLLTVEFITHQNGGYNIAAHAD